MYTSKRTFSLAQEIELFKMEEFEVRDLYGDPNISDEKVWLYILYRPCFGVFSKELHLYFVSNRVVECRVRHYFLGIYIF